MAGFFTGKKKKEEYIRELMNGFPSSVDYYTIKKRCTPLNAKDLAGRELNSQIIYYLNQCRGSDFAADAVKQASNSEALINSVKEEFIAQLMDRNLDNDVRDVFRKVCAPLTAKDFAGKTLSKEIVYYLDLKLDTDLAADVVKQASNSETLMKNILDDLTSQGYEKNKYDFRHAESILKAAYRRGMCKKEIEAKQGVVSLRHDDNGMGCAWHEDHTESIYFKL